MMMNSSENIKTVPIFDDTTQISSSKLFLAIVKWFWSDFKNLHLHFKKVLFKKGHKTQRFGPKFQILSISIFQIVNKFPEFIASSELFLNEN